MVQAPLRAPLQVHWENWVMIHETGRRGEVSCRWVEWKPSHRPVDRFHSPRTLHRRLRHTSRPRHARLHDLLGLDLGLYLPMRLAKDKQIARRRDEVIALGMQGVDMVRIPGGLVQLRQGVGDGYRCLVGYVVRGRCHGADDVVARVVG